MLFLVPTFFLVFSICALYIRKRSVQCDVKIHWEVALCCVHTVPADVELFATFTIPQVEEAIMANTLQLLSRKHRDVGPKHFALKTRTWVSGLDEN